MKLGIISDIHANMEALDAVLALLDSKSATSYVCCGDLVGYGPDPNLCVERIRGLRCQCIAGNHDFGVLGRTPLDKFNPAAARALEWTRSQLTESNCIYLQNLPLTDVTDPLFLVHASPSAPDQWEYVFTLREGIEEMEYYQEPVCITGHSHFPFVVERVHGQPARLVRQNSFELRPDAKYFVNAGSVGQPRDGDPRACCILYDVPAGTMTFHRVPYDIQSVQAKIRTAGLAEFLASRLAAGR